MGDLCLGVVQYTVGAGEDKTSDGELTGSSEIAVVAAVRNVKDREVCAKAKFHHAVAKVQVAGLACWIFGVVIGLSDVHVIDLA